MLIVGSQALKNWDARLGRKPRDVDIIATEPEFLQFKHSPISFGAKTGGTSGHPVLFMKDRTIVEFEIASDENPSGKWLLENYDILGYAKCVDEKWGQNCVHPDVVVALKLSHRYLKNSPFFKKTMDDILALRGLQYRVPLKLQDWLIAREKATLDYGHPSLERDKKKFFSGDGVDYKFEHDDIHAALATIELHGNPVPAYTFFQNDDTDVSVSKKKWLRLEGAPMGPHIRNMSVLEESYVLALERSQIPNDFAIAPRVSFLIALEKVCTSITSGWWREYAWENYYQVLAMYSDDYVEVFQRALIDGKIRPYQGEAA